MKLLNFFTFIFLALATANAVAEYDRVVCPSGTTPVRVPGGWQCQSAQPGESSVVYPKYEEVDMSPEHDLEDYELVVEEEAQPMRGARNRIRRGPFIASEWY